MTLHYFLFYFRTMNVVMFIRMLFQLTWHHCSLGLSERQYDISETYFPSDLPNHS